MPEIILQDRTLSVHLSKIIGLSRMETYRLKNRRDECLKKIFAKNSKDM